MPTFVHVTDTHFCPQSRIPVSRVEDRFHEQIRSKWQGVVDICREVGAAALFHSGDLCHFKSTSLYNPVDIIRYQEWLREVGIPVYIIPGNHDLPKSSLDNIDRSAYKAIVQGAPNALCLHGYGQALSIPIQFSDGSELSLIVDGIGYKDVPNTKKALKVKQQEIEGYGTGFLSLLMVHTDALANTSEDLNLMWEVMSQEELCELVPSWNIILQGHIHQNLSILKRKSSKGSPQFVLKPWSLTRTVKDYFATSEILEKKHQPSVSVIHVDKVDGRLVVDVQYRVIPHESFRAAFLGEKVSQEIEHSKSVMSFMDRIRKEYGDPQNAFKIEDPDRMLEHMQLPDEVLSIIREYCE